MSPGEWAPDMPAATSVFAALLQLAGGALVVTLLFRLFARGRASRGQRGAAAQSAAPWFLAAAILLILVVLQRTVRYLLEIPADTVDLALGIVPEAIAGICLARGLSRFHQGAHGGPLRGVPLAGGLLVATGLASTLVLTTLDPD